MARPVAVTVRPLTASRWLDFAKLFGRSGAYSGCWCAERRLPGPEFRARTPHERRAYMQRIVGRSRVPGLLAYVSGAPAAWVSVEPRARFPGLMRSRKLSPDDPNETGVWAITCFFVGRDFRGQGLMTRLLEAAATHASKSGARILEGYPIEPRGDLAGCSGYTGIASAYRKAGFVVVRRASETQLVMRRFIRSRATARAGRWAAGRATAAVGRSRA